MEDSKTLPFFLQLGRKNIPQLKPRGVDGCFGTGASQDYLVGFHQLTILTGHGDIRELLLSPKEKLRFLNCGILLVTTGVLYVVHRQQLFQTFRIYANILYISVCKNAIIVRGYIWICDGTTSKSKENEKHSCQDPLVKM